MKLNILGEVFQQRKFQPGQVKFSTSSFKDPHIIKIANEVAKATGVSVQTLFDQIQKKVDEFKPIAEKAPILYHTAVHNIIENELFQKFWESEVPSSAPEFSVSMFYRLVRSIRADHDEFFPLRSFIDKRRLMNPKYVFTEQKKEPKKTFTPAEIASGVADKWKKEQAEKQKKEDEDAQTSKMFNVPTAAATPNGEFIFNKHFMQKLMDYSNLKGITPKGRKYSGNGGPIPDEYAYIEFLIMHEFMHYSNDDFYYQGIIPNANPMVINWVGDFRTNYLLVKSGYEELPIGLFNDMINYDRQKEYVEMYNLVMSEMDKLPKQDQNQISDQMNGNSDDHRPGQKAGEKKVEQGDADDVKPGDIDKNGEQIKKEMEKGKDADPNAKQEDGPGKGENNEEKNQPNKGHADPHDVDYSKIVPKFNWKQLIKKFVMSARPKFEDTYAKPHRRSVTATHTMVQVGAAAVKPAEKPMDFSDSKLAFIIDSSGSMSSIITTVFANAIKLLKLPMFINTYVSVIKYSGTNIIHKVNYARNCAAKVSSVEEKPKSYPLKASDVFGKHMGAGTNFDEVMVQQIRHLLDTKHNVVLFPDSDLLSGYNLVHFVSLFKEKAPQVFVVFDSRQSYIQFRQTTGISTANVTYFQ